MERSRRSGTAHFTQFSAHCHCIHRFCRCHFCRCFRRSRASDTHVMASRTQIAGLHALRNCNRVTNKTSGPSMRLFQNRNSPRTPLPSPPFTGARRGICRLPRSLTAPSPPPPTPSLCPSSSHSILNSSSTTMEQFIGLHGCLEWPPIVDKGL